MITVNVSKVLFEDKDSGFCIAACLVKSGKENIPDSIPKNRVTIKGIFPTSSKIDLKVEGRWEASKYGYNLNVDFCEEVLPDTTDGIIAYLSSGLIPGVGERIAKKIVRKFGTNTISVLENDPEQILSVRGISKKKLKAIVESFNATREARQIIAFLSPLGVSVKQCAKIREHFGDESLDIVKHKPFRLCEIKGIGFMTADSIARKVNAALDDDLRIDEAYKYILKSAEKEGHMCLHQGDLFIQTYLLLNGAVKLRKPFMTALRNHTRFEDFLRENGIEQCVSYSQCTKRLNALAEDNVIMGDNGLAYLQKNYEYESYASKDIAKRLKLTEKASVSDDKIKEEIEKLEKAEGFTLETLQKEAVKMALTNRLSIITGGPGTGKTTVLKFVLAAAKDLLGVKTEDVTLLAPTGRAASRMTESVGGDYTASTIHSKLHIAEESGGIPEPLNTKLVVVDELSMCDGFIFFKLLQSVPYSAKLLLIGDAQQLPSVGAGNVLYELLKSKAVPVTRLSVVYRQGEASLIATNCELIKNGISQFRYGNDFGLRPISMIAESAEIQQFTAETVVNTYQQALLHGYTLDEVQVLCPIRKKGSAAGATELNKLIQTAVNPQSSSKKEVTKGSTVFRVGDKVMQIKNNYETEWTKDNGETGKGVFNGECGFIVSITDDEVLVNLEGKTVVYDPCFLDELELAYAISIHKSQGSQYKLVIMPFLTAFGIMLQRNLLYTAVSRATDKMIIVGQLEAIDRAVRNNRISKRNTQLSKKIIENIEQNNKL